VWQNCFQYDPVKPLTIACNEAVAFFAGRDLLGQIAAPIDSLWKLDYPGRLLKQQSPGGNWRYPGEGEDYHLLATFKNLQTLVYQYGFDRRYPSIERACEYIFSYQTVEGDIRGFIGNQYAPYYTGLVSALLIHAGYGNDPRVEKALKWLLSMRQDDGGWVIGSPGMLGSPHLTRAQINYLTSDRNAPVMKVFDKSKPFSHSGTGMVIRAFAAHPKYRKSPEALIAARLLKGHFFREDNYGSYKSVDHWVRFRFPFWWNNLLAALDSLSLMGMPREDPDIKRAMDWFVVNQQADGLWKVSYSGIHKASANSQTADQTLWVSLAVCRVFKRLAHG
jgi:hypothetical protein